MKKTLCLLIAYIITTSTYAQKNKTQTGLVYGTDYAFLLTAPKGWVLDNKSGQVQRLSVVFYPKGESWDSANTVMYASTWTLKEKETLNDIMRADSTSERRGNPAILITPLPDIKLDNNLSAHIRELQADKEGNYEMIAYISQRNFVVLIVMTSRNKKGMDKNKNKFYELLQSYKLSKQKK